MRWSIHHMHDGKWSGDFKCMSPFQTSPTSTTPPRYKLCGSLLSLKISRSSQAEGWWRDSQRLSFRALGIEEPVPSLVAGEGACQKWGALALCTRCQSRVYTADRVHLRAFLSRPVLRACTQASPSTARPCSPATMRSSWSGCPSGWPSLAPATSAWSSATCTLRWARRSPSSRWAYLQLCVCVVCVRMFFMCVLRVGGRGQASWFLILISRSLPLLQPQCSPSVCARICTYTCTHARSPASTCTKG